MSSLQICTDYLLSAGGSYVGAENEIRLFYIDDKDSLFYRDYSGSTLGPLKKVTDGVKQNTSASYLPNKSNPPLIICVSPSSHLRVLEFDEDEDEWVDSESFAHSTICHGGQVAATTDAHENPFVFFQDRAGKLVVTKGSSSIHHLPVTAISSTPLSAALVDSSVILFYIAQDHFIHYVTYKHGRWADFVLAKQSFKTVPKRFVGYITDDGVFNVFAISDNSALVVITSKGQKTVLGKVLPNGKFVPGNTEECGITIAIGGQNNICVCM